jgi:hypothetical protein
MINFVELSFSIIFSVLFGAMFFLYIFVVAKNKRLSSDLVQAEVNKRILLAQVEKLMYSKESKSLEETEGFVKFLTESRDWAFGYIEDVQAAIAELRQVADKIFPNDVVYLSEEETKDLSDKYNKLISSLPLDTKND